jgi:hypothetical protein
MRDLAQSSETERQFGVRNMTEAKQQQDQTAAPEAEVVESRRAALARMGRFAGYTAPAMLVLLGATKARARAMGSGGVHGPVRRRRRGWW